VKLGLPKQKMFIKLEKYVVLRYSFIDSASQLIHVNFFFLKRKTQ